ncbi:transcription termination/antitermination protein NusG [Tessaracoccus coleopterorum]|uniref:transcription termination/antitermination protein NusG n=1 Tax=Tessaracoccus coleopterorum TaxID=2714950 RepID=UPI0038CD234D
MTGIVGHGQQPVPLSIDEVIHMLTPSVIAKVNAAHAGAAATRRKKVEVVDFAVGDSVMVTDGPSPVCTPRSPKSTPTISGSGLSSRSWAARPRSTWNSSRSRRSKIVRCAGFRRRIHPYR